MCMSPAAESSSQRGLSTAVRSIKETGTDYDRYQAAEIWQACRIAPTAAAIQDAVQARSAYIDFQIQ